MLRTRYTDAELDVLRNFLESFVLGLLKPLREKHIIEYAHANKVVDPRPYVYTLPADVKTKIRHIIMDNPHIIDQYVVYPKIIRLVAKYRHDLFGALSNQLYRNWFEKFIGIIRKVIKQI